MVSVAAGLLAAATLCWPMSRPAGRVRRLYPSPSGFRRRVRIPGAGVAIVALGVLGWCCCGYGVALAAVLVSVTARGRWLARGRRRRALHTATGLTQALRALVAELRAGAHPALAAHGVAAESDAAVAEALTTIASASRLGGDVGRALAGHAGRCPALRPVLTQLSNAWDLVTRYGLPLAEVLDATRADLEHRTRFTKQVAARLAGPRSAAAVLAALPVVGVLLGEAMGAHPIRVLAFTPAGQLLLALGTALACAGTVWSARLTERVVPA